MAGVGVALKFWRLVDRERVDHGWSKDQLSRETAKYTPDGKAVAVSTIDNLRTSSRAPQPRVVHALADALGIDRRQAQIAAGVLPDPAAESPDPGSGYSAARDQLMRSRDISPEAKALIAATMDRAEQWYASIRPVFEQPRSIDDEHQAG